MGVINFNTAKLMVKEYTQVVTAQEGFQTQVLSCSADIAIVGGSAGSGKTSVLLLEAMRWYFVQGYGAVIFRRSYPEIVMQDGLWDQSQKFFAPVGGKPNESSMKWSFPNGSRIAFSHLQHEKDLLTHQGSQYAFIGFDELTHFSKKEFIYLISRNRSLCGVDPVIRATCNPDPQSWVAEFIEWFIDKDSGFPIPERSGVLRYFTSDNSVFVWGNTRQEVIDKCPHIFNGRQLKGTGIDPLTLVKSMTFIPGSIYDNKVLLAADPRYLGNLMAMGREDKLRLLDGNWKLSLDSLDLFPMDKLNNLSSNVVPNLGAPFYITIDHARKGRDLCVVFTWKGWAVIRIDILPISDSLDVVKVVQRIRPIYRPIPVSSILVDQDGIGVEDILRCKIFQGAAAALPIGNGLKPDHINKRTQNYFKASEMIDKNFVSIDINNVYLWEKQNGVLLEGRRVTSIEIGGKTFDIEYLIKEDLRTVKRYRADGDGRKAITPKEQQKNALGGRSPDFGDNFMMRADFDLIPSPKFIRRRV